MLPRDKGGIYTKLDVKYSTILRGSYYILNGMLIKKGSERSWIPGNTIVQIRKPQ